LKRELILLIENRLSFAEFLSIHIPFLSSEAFLDTRMCSLKSDIKNKFLIS